MFRKVITRAKAIPLILVAQIIPLVLFPLSTFVPTGQEWWLPVLLGLLSSVGVFQLVFRHSLALWPWFLISFAQGFNIISRLMMIMPHAILIEEGVQILNVSYIVITVISMAISFFFLWYIELPEVRLSVAARA